MDETVLLWLKRDLRVADHPALVRALEVGGVVLPLYIAEPEYWALADTSARQWDFIAESLVELGAAFGRLGAPLILRTGDAVAVLDDLRRETGFARMVSHEETGNLWTYARDRRVAAWARGNGVAWDEVPQSGVVRRLHGRDGWAARRERFVRQVAFPVPAAMAPHGVACGAIPSAADLGLAREGGRDRQIGGRTEAERLLDSFLRERGQEYRRAMSSPLTGAVACSRLSPYLAYGTLSVREAAQAGARRKAEVKGTRAGWSGSLSSFAARLAWRDHFTQKLEDDPQIETRCLHSAYETLRPRTPDAARLAAWQAGETGLPFVDACMRSLIATGWLNFRMRSMLMAVASYHLWLDWRSTGPHLARMFTDYEPGIHWPQCQMQSGTTGMNTVRIYNPVKQGLDQDPEGVFTRRWVPELAEVPLAHLQTPWRWTEGAGTLSARYPAPIVDVSRAAAEARDKVWAVRRGEDFRSEAARIVDKHASRKGTAHFVNDRAPRRKAPKARKSPPEQGSFVF